MLVNTLKILNGLFGNMIHGNTIHTIEYILRLKFYHLNSTITSYCLWRAIASLVPDMSKTFREVHLELIRYTQVECIIV